MARWLIAGPFPHLHQLIIKDPCCRLMPKNYFSAIILHDNDGYQIEVISCPVLKWLPDVVIREDCPHTYNIFDVRQDVESVNEEKDITA